MLSDFLKQNGDIELKKRCGIKNHIWEAMMNNELAPSVKMFHRIVNVLAGDSAAKKKAFTKSLWGEILKLTAHPRSINMVLHKKAMVAPRPRFKMRGKFPQAYNPPKYTQWKRETALLIGQMGTITGPCRIYVEYHLQAKTYPLGPHAMKSDIDNFDKAFLDALQLNGLLEDDKDVYWMDSRKYSSYDDFIKFTIWFDTISNQEKGLF